MPGSLLSSALLLLWPGLGLTRGRIRAFIPAIYLHLGPIAGLPVAGLMMAGRADDDLKWGVSLCPKFWRSLIRAGQRSPGQNRGCFLYPILWGLCRLSRFFWAVGVWRDSLPSFPSLCLSCFIFALAQTIAHKKTP